MSLPELFKEYFGSWVKDILRIDETGTDVIHVYMQNGKEYLFGKRKNEIFLETIHKI